jgi:hypothetical protein
VTEVPGLPDVDTATYAEIHRALATVAHEHHLAPHDTTGLPERVPPDVATWWRAAWRRRLEFIATTPRGPLHVGPVAEPMTLRKVPDSRKPPPTPPTKRDR